VNFHSYLCRVIVVLGKVKERTGGEGKKEEGKGRGPSLYHH
jgi:hypothetical protein